MEDYRAWYEQKIGPATPNRYVFPSCENRKYDPTRPIGSFKTAWKTVRARAGVKARYHDLRHTAITNLCESGASEETIMSIAGHVSREMLSRYATSELRPKGRHYRRSATERLKFRQPRRQHRKMTIFERVYHQKSHQNRFSAGFCFLEWTKF